MADCCPPGRVTFRCGWCQSCLTLQVAPLTELPVAWEASWAAARGIGWGWAELGEKDGGGVVRACPDCVPPAPALPSGPGTAEGA